LRNMWRYGFIAFLSKEILQALWIEMVGFLSQNYITPHSNLVNMIVLLEYFPTSINTSIWNNFVQASIPECYEHDKDYVCLNSKL
jgi:hypothetical protein